MSAPAFCPACEMPLALFTPREALAHVNQCLDAQQGLASAGTGGEANVIPPCAVCSRDLSTLTEAARNDHVNRCVDSRLPLPPPAPRRPPRRTRQRATPADSTDGPQPARRQTNATERRSDEAEKGDPRVIHLLQMLGLSRFAGRFAREEIDLVALRLLSEADLATMSIPESGRRRIADAMHSVEILAELQRAYRNGIRTRSNNGPDVGAHDRSAPAIDHEKNTEGREEDRILDAPPVPTQRFAESRLRQRSVGSKSKALLDDTSGEEDYIPSIRGHEMPGRRQMTRTGQSEAVADTETNESDFAQLQGREYGQADGRNEAEMKENDAVKCTTGRPATAMSDMVRNASSSRGRTNSTEAFDDIDVKPGALKDRLRGTERCDDSDSQVERQKVVCNKDKNGIQWVLNDDSDSACNACHPVRPKSSQDSSGSVLSSLASDLGNVNEALRCTSQISMDLKLMKWRERQIEREERRHKRILERIERKYAKALKQSFGESVRINGNGCSEQEKERNDEDEDDDIEFDHNVIDLTQDVWETTKCDGSRKDEEDGEEPLVDNTNNRDQKRWTILSQSISTPSVTPHCKDGVISNDNSADDGKSHDDVMAHRGFLGFDSDDEGEEILDLLRLEREKDKADDTGEATNGIDTGDTAFDESENDSNGNVLDLVDKDGDENEFGSAIKAAEETEEGEGTQSRLKKRNKRPKASKCDIIRAIEADGELHDDVLLMHSVPFDRFWRCMKKQDLNVSKKAVHEFLLNEGIMFNFKGDSATKPSSQKFLQMLNSDRRES